MDSLRPLPLPLRPPHPNGSAKDLSGAVSQSGLRRLHVVFVVDASGSMTGERIGSLNWAARAAIPAMREAAADFPEIEVVVQVIRFGDTADWIVAEPTPVSSFFWASLTAAGESRMGAALGLLAAEFRTLDTVGAPLLPPVVVLFSDGYPSDDHDAGLAALLGTEWGRQAIRIAIAIGPDADLEILNAFTGNPTLKPLRANNADMLVSHFRWAASVPIAASAMGLGPGRLVAESGLDPDDTQNGLIW